MTNKKREAIRAAVAAMPSVDPEEHARARDLEMVRSAVKILTAVDTGLLSDVVAELKKSRARGAEELHQVSDAVLQTRRQVEARTNASATRARRENP